MKYIRCWKRPVLIHAFSFSSIIVVDIDFYLGFNNNEKFIVISEDAHTVLHQYNTESRVTSVNKSC